MRAGQTAAAVLHGGSVQVLERLPDASQDLIGIICGLIDLLTEDLINDHDGQGTV
jgi:hypothetical protein